MCSKFAFDKILHDNQKKYGAILSSKDALFLRLQLFYFLFRLVSNYGLLEMLFFTVGLHFCGGCN